MDVAIDWLKDNWLPLTIIGGYVFMIPIVVFIIARFGDVGDIGDAAGIAIFWPLTLLMVIVFYPLKWLIEIPFKLGEDGWKKKHISKDKFDDESEYDGSYYNDSEEDDY